MTISEFQCNLLTKLDEYKKSLDEEYRKLSAKEDTLTDQAEQIQDTLIVVLDLAQAMTSIDVNPTRYISALSSTCSVCQFVESVDIPDGATIEDITEAIQVLRNHCPECEEEVRVLKAKNDGD